MDKNLRKKVVLAMELLVRSVNNEEYLDSWLMCGVPDGDIEYGSNDINDVDEYFIQDENFKDLISLFLLIMYRAWKNGGLYIDKVVSKDRNDE